METHPPPVETGVKLFLFVLPADITTGVIGDMHQPSRKKRSQRSKSRKSNTNSGSDSSYNKSEKGSGAKKDDLIPVRHRLPTNDPGLPPMPPIRGPSSYNGVRSGSFDSFGVNQYSVPGLIDTLSPSDRTIPYNQ